MADYADYEVEDTSQFSPMPIQFGVPLYGTLLQGRDYDYYDFTVVSGSRYKVNLKYEGWKTYNDSIFMKLEILDEYGNRYARAEQPEYPFNQWPHDDGFYEPWYLDVIKESGREWEYEYDPYLFIPVPTGLVSNHSIEFTADRTGPLTVLIYSSMDSKASDYVVRLHELSERSQNSWNGGEIYSGWQDIGGVEEAFPGGRDYFEGTPRDDLMYGGAGPEEILGLEGNDTIRGGAGADTLRGGPGDDQLFGGEGGDLLDGGPGNDSLWGGLGDNLLIGGDGDDMLFSAGGNDTLIGGDGYDTAFLSAASDAVEVFRADEGLRLVLADAEVIVADDIEEIKFTDRLLGYDEVAARVPNIPPTGAVVITGTARQGDELVADTATLADADGLGKLAYQWLADGATIAGATTARFTPGQAEVGKALTVTVSYTDGYGTDEAVTSTATARVENVNDLPTGAVTITGTARQGDELVADTSTLADADGLGKLAYQWLADGVAIAGGNQSPPHPEPG